MCKAGDVDGTVWERNVWCLAIVTSWIPSSVWPTQGALIVMHCLLNGQVIWVPEPSPITRLLPVIYAAVRLLIADAQCTYRVGGLGRYEHTRPPRVTSVITFSQARCVRCDTALAVRAEKRPPSLRIVNRMSSFAAFITAHMTVCNTIQSPCNETWTRCREVEIQSLVLEFSLDIRCSNL